MIPSTHMWLPSPVHSCDYQYNLVITSTFMWLPVHWYDSQDIHVDEKDVSLCACVHLCGRRHVMRENPPWSHCHCHSHYWSETWSFFSSETPQVGSAIIPITGSLVQGFSVREMSPVISLTTRMSETVLDVYRSTASPLTFKKNIFRRSTRHVGYVSALGWWSRIAQNGGFQRSTQHSVAQNSSI